MTSVCEAMKTIIVALLGTALALHAQEQPTQPAQPPLTLEARCAHPFGDHAVLQQGMPVPVWGWTLPGAKVEVTFERQTRTTTAGADGTWRVTLDPLTTDKLKSVNEAPVGHKLTITTALNGRKATKVFSDILVGEVWLCSGQSNMEGKFGRAAYPPGSQKEANYPGLRNLTTEWTVCTPQTVGGYYRIAVSFAREIQREILEPVGLLSAAWAGTSIEGWFHDYPPAVKYKCYAVKIQPLVGYAMRGALWYQGESNVKDGQNYLPKMKRLIDGWRQVWHEGDFPFYFVQLSPIYQSPTDQPAGGDGRAAIRQAQFEALAITNTGMVVTMDIGSVKEHPLNKHDVGLRLARWALYRDYGRKDIVPSGPLYKSCRIEGSTIRIRFDYAEHGLMLAKKDGYNPPTPTPGAAMPWLSIKAKDGTWHWAEGRIEGSELVVSSKDVKEPVAVRYAYTNHPAGCNLYNKDGLPSAPFTTCGY
jgi:sialate O-acetylesterase